MLSCCLSDNTIGNWDSLGWQGKSLTSIPWNMAVEKPWVTLRLRELRSGPLTFPSSPHFSQFSLFLLWSFVYSLLFPKKLWLLPLSLSQLFELACLICFRTSSKCSSQSCLKFGLHWHMRKLQVIFMNETLKLGAVGEELWTLVYAILRFYSNLTV